MGYPPLAKDDPHAVCPMNTDSSSSLWRWLLQMVQDVRDFRLMWIYGHRLHHVDPGFVQVRPFVQVA